MNEKEIGAFAVAEMHNEKLYPSHEARAFMNDRTALHLRDLEYRHSLYEEMGRLGKSVTSNPDYTPVC